MNNTSNEKSWLWEEFKFSSIVIWAAQRQLTGFGTECTDLLYTGEHALPNSQSVNGGLRLG